MKIYRYNSKKQNLELYVLISNQFDIKYFSKNLLFHVFLALSENLRMCILSLKFFITPPFLSLENCKRVQGFLDLK